MMKPSASMLHVVTHSESFLTTLNGDPYALISWLPINNWSTLSLFGFGFYTTVFKVTHGPEPSSKDAQSQSPLAIETTP